MSRFRIAGCLAASAVLLAMVAGCGQAPPPTFAMNMQGLNPNDFVIKSSDNEDERQSKETFIKGREQIATALFAMFGTPDEPFVFPESGLNLDLIKMASGPSFDPQSPQRGLYRVHCAHCHGINGDGAGPTAAFLNPYPRDYRKGQFKFKSTQRAARPTDDDLMRVLHAGINGTAMPSFMLLPEDERAALVEYVKYLSMRGECEEYMRVIVYIDGEELPMTKDELVGSILQPVAERWADAPNQIIEPVDRPPMTSDELAASIKAGREIYFDAKKGQCINCHGPTQLGDGGDQNLYDDWNKDKPILDAIYAEIRATKAKTMPEPSEPFATAEARREAEKDFEAAQQSALQNLYTQIDILNTWLLPKQQLRPRNLRMGIYRFGRTPADLYRRVYAGINGTPMPGAGAGPGSPGSLTPEQIWNVVDYVKSLPYLPMSQPMGENPGEISDAHRILN